LEKKNPGKLIRDDIFAWHDFFFDISDNTFEIRYNNSMFSESAAYDVYPGHGGSGISDGNFYSSSSTTLSNRTPGISRTAELFNTYYIYTFDGKLLAEYDHNGNCTRDYIYFGKRMLAEYKPQTGEYFYYMSEQINSTRIITNDNGDVVFSEAYGSYGDVQKTWVNTYDPDLKFSGKEREGYSGLDYFGARYYDHKSYRFNSVDPVINKTEALYNPQAWNLYAYCNNNPITYYDPDGRFIIVAPWLVNPATIAAITAAATAGAIATHNLIKSIDIDEVVEDVIEFDIAVVKTGLDIFASSLPMNSPKLAEILKKDGDKSGGASSKEKEFKRSISGESAKQASKDAPSWAKGKRPYKGESGKDFAKRLLDEKYGKGNWEKGSNTEHNKIKKYGDRAFE
jgi:RHS repeat-associated protein